MKTTPTVESIAGIYTITDAKIKTGAGEKDVYDSFDECQKNNTYGFNKDMVWYLGGVAKQSCTGPDDSGTWALNGNTLTITSSKDGAYTYSILDFDGKNLVTSSDGGENGTNILTFTKQ